MHSNLFRHRRCVHKLDDREVYRLRHEKYVLVFDDSDHFLRCLLAHLC
jgi:hypothetical protein